MPGQDPNDPRIQQFYTKQREQDELKASQGDTGAQQQLGKIQGKLSRGGRAGVVPKEMTNGSDLGTRPVAVQDDPMSYIDPAVLGPKIVGSILEHIMPKVAQKATQGATEAATRMASRLFPDAENAGTSAVGRHGLPVADEAGSALRAPGSTILRRPAAAGAKVVGKATVKDVGQKAIGQTKALPGKATVKDVGQKAIGQTKALPGKASRMKNVTPKGELGKKIAANLRKQGAVVKGAIARRGSKNTDAIAAKAAPTRKALPAPKKDLGPDFKQPKTVKAGSPRAKQTSQRANGTNSRNVARKAKEKGA